MQTAIDTRFFRAGVGTVIYTQAGEVALFERAQHPVGVWQFQQGGIDLGEHPEETLWRELKEEIGLEKTDFDTVTQMPNWTVHQVATSVDDASKSRIGQAYLWYFLELKSDVTIDLTKALEDEAANYKWVSFTEAIKAPEELKKHIYRELETYFQNHILPQTSTPT